MSEKSLFKGPFHKQYGKRAQTVLQSGRRHLYHIYWSLQTQFSWKKAIWVLCKILRLSVNILTADEKYFLLKREKLTQPIQILFSLKQKTWSDFSIPFWNQHKILDFFKKKVTVIGGVFPKLQTAKNVIRWISEKSRLRGPFHKQHGKRAQTLFQSGRRYLYHIYWSLWT